MEAIFTLHKAHLTGQLKDTNGNTVSVDGDVSVYDTPTVQVSVTTPEPIYVGDKVNVNVSGTTDADLGPGVASLSVNGQDVTANQDGTFTFVAS